MRLASPEEFATAYTQHRWHEGYAKRARLFASFPDPILVVGCGFGYLVEELLQLGKSAWGVDLSDYAEDNCVTENFSKVDITGDISLLPPFATIITEDLLPWLTDDEAAKAAKNCSAHGAIVIHLVTVAGEADYNYHSTAEWMTLTHQLTVSLEGM